MDRFELSYRQKKKISIDSPGFEIIFTQNNLKICVENCSKWRLHLELEIPRYDFCVIVSYTLNFK